MDLLTAADWTDIRSAIHDVTDTFLKKSITYIRRDGRKLSKFHESRADDLVHVNYILITLVVPENTDRTYSQVRMTKEGFVDLSEGYLLFSYPDLRDFSPSMIDGLGKPVFVTNKDSFVVNGQELTIIGVNLVGPTQSDFQLVKVHFKKQLEDSKMGPLVTVLPLITNVGSSFDITFDFSFQEIDLSVSTGTWSGASPITYSYQWKRDGVDISGAVSATYSVLVADGGTIITCQVTATNSQGTTTVTTEGFDVA